MTPTTDTIPALDALRHPIREYRPQTPAAEAFRGSMLDLADELEELWADDAAGALETDVVWTAVHAFPGLVAPGPTSGELVDLVLGGHLVDADTADTLHTLGDLRRMLRRFEPPGFAAALWRAALLAVYQLIEVFVVLGDARGTDQCFELLATAERRADKFSGRS